MGKRLAPVLAILVMFMPAAAHALGLGNMAMNSALNQPLDAEIELISVQKGDLGNLSIRLGSTEDFDRVGVIREFFYTEIKFVIAKKPNGTSYVQLTTTKPIVEPFLDFVVEARWARGRILREFTVLVDPPVLSEEAPAPIQQAAVASAPAPAPQARRQSIQPAAQPAPIRERAVLKPVLRRNGELSYGPVKYKDTLFDIANQMRPSGVTINQMMIALARENPQAFYNGNINQMKAGFVLRIEDEATITAMSSAQASSEVERQRVEWEARKSGKIVRQTGDAPAGGRVARGDAPRGSSSAAEQARLKLVAPGSEGTGSGAGDEDASRLRQDLLLAAEALDANKQETDELKARLSEMEEQLESMQRLIMLKDDEMTALQQQLGKDVTEKPAEVTPEAAETGTEPEPEATSEAPAMETPAPVAPATPRPEPGLLDDPMVMYGGIGLAVLLVAGFMIQRRRKMQDGFEESILNVGDGKTGAVGATAESMAENSESTMVSDFAMSEMSGMSGIEADAADVDPISEADVYLAYGRHQQAEDILNEALEKEPTRHDVKLKLLEVYFAAKNREAFEQGALELHDALGDEGDPLWAKAVTMGSQLCPGSELFGGTSAETLKEELAGEVTSSDEDLLDFDFDLDSVGDVDAAGGLGSGDSEIDDVFAELEAATTTASAEPAADSSDGEEDLLDFDMDMGTTAESEEKPAEAGEKKDDNSLDFDVSSLDFDLDAESSEDKPVEAQPETAVAEDSDNSLDFDGLDFDTGSEPTTDATAESSGTDDAVAELDDLLGDDLTEDAFGEVDEVGTKLDLAKAYVDMGDSDGAKSILDEVMEEGDEGQKAQAQELLGQLS